MSTAPSTAEPLHLAQWQDRLQDAIDQALSPSETLQVHTHLGACAMCTKEHRRLLAVDARLRGEFALAATPSPHFDQRLFANIAALEQDKRVLARQREQQEYTARLAQLRGSWRELVRFQLGNIIAGIATIAAVATAIVSAWPAITASISKDLIGAQQVSWLPQGWTSAVPITAIVASAAIAAAAMWITRRIDRRPS